LNIRFPWSSILRSQPGGTYLIVLEGINDIGQPGVEIFQVIWEHHRRCYRKMLWRNTLGIANDHRTIRTGALRQFGELSPVAYSEI
jgi:hypothetical protein